MHQGADAQGGAAGIGTGQGDLAALGDREVADGLDGLRRGGAAEAERAAVQVDAGGVVPAPFPAGDGTELVGDDDLTAWTQDEAVRVGAGGGVEEGGRAVVGERVGIELERAEDLDDTGAERRGAARSRARIKRHPRSLEDRGAAAEVVRVADDDVAGRARLRAAEPVVTFQTDLETRAAGEHVVRAAEDEAGIRSARDAVDIARADAERRGEVVDFRIEEALQDRAAVADGGEVERRIPHRTGERQGHAVSAAEVGRGEDGRGEIAVEDDGAEGVELAERTERGRGVQAAVAGETQRGAGVDADVGRAQGRTRGGGDLHHALLDVDAAGEAGVGVARDDQVAVRIEITRTKFDEITRTGEGAGQLDASTRTRRDGIDEGVVAEDAGRTADAQAVAQERRIGGSGHPLRAGITRRDVLIDGNRSRREDGGDERTSRDISAADRHAHIPAGGAADGGDVRRILSERAVAQAERRDRADALDGKGLIGEIQVPDLEHVPHGQEERITETVHVDRGRSADVQGEAIAGLAAEDDRSADHAGVGLQIEGAAVEVDDRLGAAAETAQREARLGIDGTAIEIRAAAEGVVARFGRSRDGRAEREGAVAGLREAGLTVASTDAIDEATGEEGVG